MVRISKIYKSLSQSNEADNQKEVIKKKGKKDSKVGRVLSELATKAVIIMCFVLLILLPLFNGDFWNNPNTGTEGAAQGYKQILEYPFAVPVDVTNLEYSFNDAGTLTDDTDQKRMLAYYTKGYIYDFPNISFGRLLKVELPGSTVAYYQDPLYSNFRDEEITQGNAETTKGTIKVTIQYDVVSTLEAILNIIRTFYICALLLGGSSLFSSSTYNLIINPIEKMIERVIKVIEKPQQIKQQAFIEDEEKDLALMNRKGEDEDDQAEKDEDEEKNTKSMETYIVEEAIKKIGILIAVGLGEAGSSLIQTYLNGEGDELMNAVSMDAVFGFCDIRNFTDATEVLQEEVMIFVNSIAEIIHTTTDKYIGAANKNIGDAFLLVWKIPDKVKEDAEDNGVDSKSLMSNIADMAFFAILKMYAEINRAPSLLKYVKNQRLVDRIGKGYKPKLGFGLHYGWAIEGAIGSHHKVDVSYLSPEVNIAGRLESETKGYGCILLMSGQFVDLLSPIPKELTRKVDIVGPKGCHDPLRIYTANISDKAIKFQDHKPLKQSVALNKECYVFKKLIWKEVVQGVMVGASVFQNDTDIHLLTCYNNPQFFKLFDTGMEAFEKGHWIEAKETWERGLQLDPNDGPTKNLMAYMKSLEWEVPEDWQGYRVEGGGSGH